MVVGDVGEDSTPEGQSFHSSLVQGVRADLHEAVSASLVHHHSQKSVDGYRVLGGVVRLEPFSADIVGYGGEQAALVSHVGEHPVQQCRDGGLSVCPGDAHQAQASAGMSEEVARCQGRCLP